MNIAVCVKRVPDTEARLRVGGDGLSIDTGGAKSILSPYDEYALEAALRLRETAGSGEVTLLTVGSADVAETLRTGLAMGADRAVLLEADGAPEGLAVAEALAAEIRDQSFDLLLFGLKAIDDDLQAVGPMVAELLDLPSVSAVSTVSVSGGGLHAEREGDDGLEVLEIPLPCALTVTKGAFEPRYPSLKGIMAAKKKPIETRPAKLGESGVTRLDVSLPAERTPGRIVGEGPDAIPELVRLLREEAKVL